MAVGLGKISAAIAMAGWLGSALLGSCGAHAEIGADSVAAGAQVSQDSLVSRESVVSRDSLGVYRLEEILVTASRLPSNRPLFFSNVTVASGTQIRELASSSAAEALSVDSGVGLIRYGSYGSLETMTLRGGSSNEVTYLLDGVPIADPQIAVMDLNWLPMSGTARVEAMKGGASALYGSGAIGGAVNLVSLDAMPEVPSSEVTGWRGSFDSRAVGLTLRRSFAGGLGFLGAYDDIKSGGWLPNSAYNGEKLYGKLTHRTAGGIRADAVGFKHTSEIEIPGSMPGVEKDRRSFVRFSLASLDESGFLLSYHHSASHQTYVSRSSLFPPYLYKHEGRLDGVQLEAYGRSDTSEASSFGLGVERKLMESNSVGSRSATDAYLSVQREISQGPVRLTGSLRIEKNSEFKMELSPQITAWLFLPGEVALFTKLDRSFMYPSFNDLYWRGPNEAGDPTLRTEHSRGFELGTHLKRGPAQAGATFYYRNVDDMILWRADQTCIPIRSTNLEARLKGLELSCDLTPARGLEASLSYWVGSARDGAGRRIEYRPDNIFTWSVKAERDLTGHVSCGTVFAGRNVSGVYCGDQYDYTDFTCLRGTGLPRYSSALLYAYVGIDRARLFARVTNLFNARIYSTWGMPGLPRRAYELGASWELRD